MHDFDSKWPPVHNSFTYYLYYILSIFAIPLSSRHEKCCQMLDFFGYFNALETRNLGIEKENHRSNLMSLWIYYNLEFLFFCEIVWAEQDKPQIISFLFFLFARRKSNRATMSWNPFMMDLSHLTSSGFQKRPLVLTLISKLQKKWEIFF